MKRLYLIGGTMGVGKTTVSKKLEKILDRSVFLDGDWCWEMNPFVVNDETKAMVLDNICYILNNFIKCSVYDNIIFCWVMHEQSIIDSILQRIDLNGVEVKVISLVCDKDSLAKRLEGDISAGIRQSDIIERSAARLPMYEAVSSEKIDISNITPEEAAEIIAGI